VAEVAEVTAVVELSYFYYTAYDHGVYNSAPLFMRGTADSG
jgi:hypothetical protein